MRFDPRTGTALGRVLALLVTAGLVVVACGGAASAPRALDGASMAPQVGQGGMPRASAGTGDQTVATVDTARPELLIIKTGTLDLVVASVNDAVEDGARAITALGGYVAGSDQTGDGDGTLATITYRIPAERWEDALVALRGLAATVRSEVTRTDDVTGQVVDLRARIANLEATEKALQAIMDRATTIKDILDVQAQLTTVRGQIEQATAERQHLQDQAALSTLTVRYQAIPEPAVVASQQKFDPGAEVDRASASLVEILQGLATAGIWFGIVWLPILLALGLVGLVVWLAVRRRVTRPLGPQAGPPPLAPAADA